VAIASFSLFPYLHPPYPLPLSHSLTLSLILPLVPRRTAELPTHYTLSLSLSLSLGVRCHYYFNSGRPALTTQSTRRILISYRLFRGPLSRAVRCAASLAQRADEVRAFPASPFPAQARIVVSIFVPISRSRVPLLRTAYLFCSLLPPPLPPIPYLLPPPLAALFTGPCSSFYGRK